MKKIRNIFMTAILMSALAASSAFAEAPGAGIAQAASAAPPGSEGAVLTPISVQIPAADGAQAAIVDTANMSQSATDTASSVPVAADTASPVPATVITAGQSTLQAAGPGAAVSPGVSAGPGNVAPPVSEGSAQPSGEMTQSTDNPAPAADPAAQAAVSSDAQSSASSQQTGTGRTIDPSKPMIALTFDDGPQTIVGNQIMDCLAKYGGKATFFMVGDRIASRASEVKRMVAEGHEVANHTMNHKYLQSLGAAAIQAQVKQCNDTIQAVCGVRPTIMRLPGGNHNATVRANTGMPMIQWNVDTLDWKTRNTASTVSKVLEHAKDGDVVLMHELYEATGNAAVQIIPALVARGFQLVTVSEMAAAKGITLQAGKLYSSF